MSPEQRQNWERLRKQAAWDKGSVYSTKPGNRQDRENRVKKSTKREEFRKAEKKQENDSEWRKGPHGMAEKQQEKIAA